MADENGNATLCWCCRKAITGGCSWSRDFIPVEGWQAVRKDLKPVATQSGDRTIESYVVYQCPEYKCDCPMGSRVREYHAKPIEDNEGALLLAAEIVKQAAHDYADAYKHRSLEWMDSLKKWFHGTFFRRISDLNPDSLLRKIEQTVDENMLKERKNHAMRRWEEDD